MRTLYLVAAWSGLVATAHAQVAAQSVPSVDPAAATAAATTDPASGSPAVAATPKRAWTIVPRVTVQETYTDNVAPGLGSKVSDQITELSPGIRVEGNAARVKMHLDYQFRELYYAHGTQGSQSQQSLNSFGTLEAIEKLLFVDITGTISRQNISPFGVQSPSYYTSNANSTETANYRVSPYLKGKLGSTTDYEMRYSRSALRAKSSAVSDSDGQEWLGRLKGDTPLTRLGWLAEATRQSYDYTLGRKTESDRVRGQLTYRVDPQLKLSASVGRERNDYFTPGSQSWTTSGYGAEWAPTERTQISALREKRFFGYGHNVSVNHRMARSAVKFTDTRDISALPSQLSTGGLGNIYDLLFSQMASAIPDPAARSAYVNSFLQQSGISPNSLVNTGFLNSQVTLMRRQELSYILRGVRNTLTLVANKTRNEGLGGGLSIGDNNTNVSAITQQGFSIGLSHQLTALTGLNLTGSRSRSSGASIAAGNNPESKQKSLSASLTTKLGAKTSGALTARRTEVEGSLAPYTENAVIGSISMQF